MFDMGDNDKLQKTWDKEKVAIIIEMLKNGKTLQEFSSCTGVSISSLAKLKAGYFRPSVKMILALCKYSDNQDKERLQEEFFVAAGHGVAEFKAASNAINKQAYINAEHEFEDVLKEKYHMDSIAHIEADVNDDIISEDMWTKLGAERLAHILIRNELSLLGHRVFHSWAGLRFSDFAATGRYTLEDESEWWLHFVPGSMKDEHFWDEIWNHENYHARDIIISKIAMIPPNRDRKISLVVFGEAAFNDFAKLAPLSLKVNLSVIYISLRDFRITYENQIACYGEDGELPLRVAQEKDINE